MSEGPSDARALVVFMQLLSRSDYDPASWLRLLPRFVDGNPTRRERIEKLRGRAIGG